MSKITKKYKTIYIIFSILSLLVILAPLAYYFITGFMIAEATHKFVLSMSLVMCIMLTAISIMAKLNLRCPLFIMLLGLWFVIDSIMPLLIMLSIGTILDELCLSPIVKHYKNKYIINKEIDKRVG